MTDAESAVLTHRHVVSLLRTLSEIFDRPVSDMAKVVFGVTLGLLATDHTPAQMRKLFEPILEELSR